MKRTMKKEDKASELIDAVANGTPDLAKENEALKAENAALKAEVVRLRNVAFSLEVTCKTLASMQATPSLLGGGG